jgi:cytochrome P450
VAAEDDRLPSGAVIEAGSKVFISPWVVHRDERHFPDPERFDPERFADGASQGRPRFAYFPFGGGPHVCLGQTFATMECVLVLARIAQRFRFELLAGEPQALRGFDLRAPKGVRVRVRRPAG